MTGWKWSPDVVARILAGQDKTYGITIDSFHLAQDGRYHRMLPKEWDVIRTDLQALSDNLRGNETTDNESYPEWRRQSVKTLPPATFVWLDDLEKAASSAFSRGNRGGYR